MTKAIEKTLAEKKKCVRKTRTYRLHVCLLALGVAHFRYPPGPGRPPGRVKRSDEN